MRLAEAAGLKVEDFAIAGVDGVTDAINAVKAGEMASSLQDANAQAQGALDIAIKAAKPDYQPQSPIWKQYPSMQWAEGKAKAYLLPWTPVTTAKNRKVTRVCFFSAARRAHDTANTAMPKRSSHSSAKGRALGVIFWSLRGAKRRSNPAAAELYVHLDRFASLAMTENVPQSNRLETLVSLAVRSIASPISCAIEITRMLRATFTASVGMIESVITSSLSFEPAMRAVLVGDAARGHDPADEDGHTVDDEGTHDRQRQGLQPLRLEEVRCGRVDVWGAVDQRAVEVEDDRGRAAPSRGHAAARATELGASVAISLTHTRAMAGAVAMVGA